MQCTQPIDAPNWNILEAHDADEQAHNLRNWQQQFDQFSSGRFYGRIQELALPDVHLFREYTSQALIQQCNVQPDSVWLGFAVRQQNCRINGLEIRPDELMCRPGSHDFELVTPEDFDIYGIVINQQALVRCAEQNQLDINDKTFQPAKRFSDGKKLNHLRHLLFHLIHPEQSGAFQQDILLNAVLELLVQEQTKPTSKPSFQRRKQAVDQVRQFVSEHTLRTVTMTELCDLVHMSRRSLQYSFEDVLGTSPLKYLRNVRLNAVRREIQKGIGDDRTIASLAADFGFWHAAQFSADYKQLFGESPSQTLKTDA